MLKSTVFSSMDAPRFLGSESPSSVLIIILVFFLLLGWDFFCHFFDSTIVTSKYPFFSLLPPSCCQPVVLKGCIYSQYGDSKTLQVDCLKDARSL